MRRPPTTNEGAVIEDEGEASPPDPPESPAFLWLPHDAPGATLPPPLPLPDWEMRFAVTSAWRRRWLLGVLGNAGMQLALIAGIGFVLNGGDLAGIPTVMWSIGIGLALFVLVVGLMRPGPLALTLTEGGFNFEHSSFRLQAGWGSVVRLVQLGRDESTLALRLDKPGVAWERPTNAKPWRRTPYPWDTTVPLEPFALGDQSRQVQARVAGAVPALQGVPAEVVAAHAETPGRRAAGFIIGLVPIAVGMAVLSQVLGDGPVTAFLRTAIMVGLGALTLARWNGTTGERTADYVARVALGPSQEPRRTLIPVLARVYAPYALFLGIGFVLWTTSAPSVDLTAKYGPAHTCWKNDAGLISGCLMRDGTMRGDFGGTEVTCFFVEPLPATQTVFHCK
jgi:hypothetical protein